MAGPSPTPRTDPLPADLGVIAGRVELRVEALLDEEQRRWSALDPVLAEPIVALRSLVMAGGKRLRPAFCHWGFVGAGGDPADPAVVDAGAAFELLQGFALIHDDVMDGSAVRRGAPAVHRQFGDRHQAAHWTGEDRRFGEGVAILVGDLAIVYADRVLPPGPVELSRLWDELRTELNIGQYLDLLGTATGGVDRSGARRIARYKSGKYTIERPLQLGATLAGRPDLIEPLSRYGEPLGEAFQLRDDILGVWGDVERTGKPVGDDLREGKPTLLLAVAHERAGDTQRRLLGRVGEGDLSPDVIADLQACLVSTGALAEAEAEIATLAERAIRSLDEVPVTSEARSALRDLGAFVVARDA
ncbi:polyprenyl synthetase family protein [soil metagenome]